MPCTLRVSPHVAGRGPAWRSPAASVAERGLASPGVAAPWLPTWLPESVSAAKCLRDYATTGPCQMPHRGQVGATQAPGVLPAAGRACGHAGPQLGRTGMNSMWIPAAWARACRSAGSEGEDFIAAPGLPPSFTGIDDMPGMERPGQQRGAPEQPECDLSCHGTHGLASAPTRLDCQVKTRPVSHAYRTNGRSASPAAWTSKASQSSYTYLTRKV
jgi:hypothetical protein